MITLTERCHDVNTNDPVSQKEKWGFCFGISKEEIMRYFGNCHAFLPVFVPIMVSGVGFQVSVNAEF